MVCWDVEGHGCLGFHMGGINISGRIKQSIYPRTRHGELKVISMIYAPPYLIRRSVEGEVDRTLASSPTVTPRAQKTANTGKQATVAHYYYGANTSKHQQEGNTRHRTKASHLPSRTVTNRLSGVPVTHDEYRTFIISSSCLATSDQSTVINMETQTNMAWHTNMAKG